MRWILRTQLAYCTKMHGGCLRFQAQYLRRIRLPHWHTVSSADQRMLTRSDTTGTLDAVCRIYQLTECDRAHLTDDPK